MSRFCEECQRDTYYSVTGDGYSVCCDCGLVDPHYVHLVSNFPVCVDEETIASGEGGGGCEGIWINGRKWKKLITSSLWSSKGRYKPIFHWNERIAQMCCMDPEVPDKYWKWIWIEVFDGTHGPR